MKMEKNNMKEFLVKEQDIIKMKIKNMKEILKKINLMVKG